jgi:hypothetical protein
MPQVFSFQDCHAPKPRTWQFSLTAGEAERIKVATEGKIDLLAPTAEMFQLLYTDQRTIITVIWTLLGPQTEKQRVSLPSFVDALDGTVMRVMKERFWRALEDFFPERATSLRTFSSEQLALMTEVDQFMNTLTIRQRSLVMERLKVEASAALDAAEADNKAAAAGMPTAQAGTAETVQAGTAETAETPPGEPGTTSSGSEPSSDSTGDSSPSASSSSPGRRTSKKSGSSRRSSSPTNTTPSPSSRTSARRSESEKAN